MTDPRKLAWCDTETTKLGPGRRPWEIAVIRRPPGGDVRHDTSYLWHIDVDDLDLGNADPKSLEIGGFYQRHPQMNGTATRHNLYRLTSALRGLERVTRGAVILGSNPGFDTETLEPLMRAASILPSWHYHPLDLPSMAEGWLRGRGRALPAELKSDALCRAVGVDPNQYERHTALGDCQLFRAVYDVVTAVPTLTYARITLAAELERAGSPLCTCQQFDGSPMGADGKPMDHHCDCPAVTAAATVLQSMSATRHALRCFERDGSMDGFYTGTREGDAVAAGAPAGKVSETT